MSLTISLSSSGMEEVEICKGRGGEEVSSEPVEEENRREVAAICIRSVSLVVAESGKPEGEETGKPEEEEICTRNAS